MRELVIVIADLYLGPGAQAAAAAQFRDVPGIEHAGRFGTRDSLGGDWRAWLAGHLGCADLAQTAPALVAAMRLAAWHGPQPHVGYWIVSPVHLSAGLTRVHLSHRGLLQLTPGELEALAAQFAGTFGADGAMLSPLPSGDLLLRAPLSESVATMEPARCIGQVSEVLPAGAASAALRRLMAEMEMWLHALELNAARARARQLPVTALWPWGGAGRSELPPAAHLLQLPAAYGADAWVEGLWQVCGRTCAALPERLDAVLAESTPGQALLVLRIARELAEAEDTPMEALARLDARYVSPALGALRAGELRAVTLILNDACVRLQRASRLRLWRRRRAGLASFA